ncbi:phosphoribosylformylglycinamidine cyclo-ligase [Ornithobacterium rhinotracheale]|uniref:phosphoribosylformylglycinamidine cyclo-ligase n=1 Tax=Ornithobacterium rhinotracheale TaxID=28251 RepID=UPI00129CFDA0|nr:phosphoribosylformylglycinamidine cyclo-ligase [Ornithobacterium rhinotracheale]MRI62381.1 phosphoribosylformylglycinamidine cyclo-ligase [Ornithobacterium rhinotracheale]
MKTSYKDAGVNKEEGYQTVHKIKDVVASTHSPNVLNGIGSFGAFYELGYYKNPVLVSGTDGVGTKLRIALDVKKYDTVGIDCFAMCANDILCHGAKPLFFLDYLACGKLDSNVAAEIVGGIVEACKQTNCSLIGGETAEMPGMYEIGDYDLAGFCVGVVEKEQIIDGANIKQDDVLIALPSSGFHSNGFSLIRKVFTDFYEEWDGKPLYETLLIPTKLYGATISSLLEKYQINGIAHITGGGLIENVPRILPKGLGVEIQKSKIEVPAVMQELQKRGNIAEEEMFGTFNMGVGMVLAISAEQAESIIKYLKSLGENAYEIGKVVKSQVPISLL